MPDWGWWVLGALALLGIEALTLDLVFASLAIGSIVGALLAVAGVPVLGQGIGAVGAALLTLFLLRPVGLRLLKTEGTETNVEALLGKGALVIERVDARSGRVKIGGEIWSARVRNPETEFAAGRELIVISIDGATAIVDAPNSEPATGSVGE